MSVEKQPKKIFFFNKTNLLVCCCCCCCLESIRSVSFWINSSLNSFIILFLNSTSLFSVLLPILLVLLRPSLLLLLLLLEFLLLTCFFLVFDVVDSFELTNENLYSVDFKFSLDLDFSFVSWEIYNVKNQNSMKVK